MDAAHCHEEKLHKYESISELHKYESINFDLQCNCWVDDGRAAIAVYNSELLFIV